MPNTFKICDKCKGTNVESMIKHLKEIDANAKTEIRCQQICGIGRTKSFIIVNDELIIGNTELEVIEKVKNKLRK